MRLEGVTALITGSTGVLGSAVVMALAKAGCNCVCHYHTNRAGAEQLVGEVERLGAKGCAVGADLTQSGGAEYLIESAKSMGIPRVLVNSAAIFFRQPLREVEFEQAQRVFSLNVTAAIMTSRAFAELLRGKRGSGTEPFGTIINIADVGGIRPWAEYVVYCSSKSGLIGATKALAKELAPDIQVNSVAPGVISRPGEFDKRGKSRQLSFIPAGRIGGLSDVTDGILFLLRNDYITGQVLAVDGGRSI